MSEQVIIEELSRLRRMLEELLDRTPSALAAMNNKQLADYYGVDPSTIYRWRKCGRLDEDNLLSPEDGKRSRVLAVKEKRQRLAVRIGDIGRINN
ncbi:MAG: hypothetical protein AAFX93_20535 [Verrucomicrobiota bacterium]